MILSFFFFMDSKGLYKVAGQLQRISSGPEQASSALILQTYFSDAITFCLLRNASLGNAITQAA